MATVFLNPSLFRRTLVRWYRHLPKYIRATIARCHRAATATHLRAITGSLVVLVATPLAAGDSLPVIQHTIDVDIDPQSRRIVLRDLIQFPAGIAEWTVLLDGELEATLENSPGAQLQPMASSDATGLRQYRLVPTADHKAEISVRGQWADDYEQARGQVSDAGVYLPPHSGWMPVVANSRTVFDLRVALPQGWVSVSQGSLESSNGIDNWTEQTPQPGIWLIAGRYFRHEATHNNVKLSAWFFKSNPDLSRTYFASATTWLDRYSALLGPYPYQKLAVVENFWQSGYGMPSFALLGSKVVNLPFIPHTAWPHEILHNWFGNGVYASQDGNWSEGLTAYLADHAIRELNGEGAAFRRDALQKFSSFIDDGEDLPLSDFRFRHDNETAVVGYDKALMVFHMLRTRTGDRGMKNGLKKFIKEHLHDNASWADIEAAMSAATGEDLRSFFAQWRTRTGAPELALSDAGVDGNCATGVISQTQESAPYDLRVPVFVSFDNQTVRQNLLMTERQKAFSICVAAPPERLSVDPQFDVFRKLHDAEVPASISQLIGASDALAILPASAPADELDSWRAVVDAAGVRSIDDTRLDKLPEGGAIWVLGADNHFAPALLESDDGSVSLGDANVSTDRNALILVRRQAGRPVGFASVPPGGDALALMKRVQHYGRYSYLAFAAGDRIAGVRGQWPVADDSPLSKSFTQNARALILPARQSLIDADAGQ